MLQSNKQHKISHIAYTEALKSKCKMKHGAVITKGSKIICKGYNSSRSKYLNHNKGCMHAEVAVAKEFEKMIKKKHSWRCIKTKNNKYNLSGYTLWVVRASMRTEDLNNLKCTESRPCQNCTCYLKKLGFKKIAYSDSNGNINIVNLNSYHNDHLSDYQKSIFKTY